MPKTGSLCLVSACLAGASCRYDTSSCANEKVLKLINTGKAVPVCPEQLAGLPTPRAPCEIVLDKSGKKTVVTKDGKDMTEDFLRGARRVLALCQALDIKEAILKSNSPSCGCGEIYDGSFSGKLAPGDGLTAELLKKNGIRVRTEQDF